MNYFHKKKKSAFGKDGVCSGASEVHRDMELTFLIFLINKDIWCSRDDFSSGGRCID